MTAAALSESMEDYVEAILLLMEEKRVARSKDIAARLRVKTSSVTGALQGLSEKGLVNYAPYDVVTLTAAGMGVARGIRCRHEALREFFVDVLGAEEGEAEEAACRMEHAMPEGILRKFTAYVHEAKASARAGRRRCRVP